MNAIQKLTNKSKKLVIGLMSGTSMDGIDASLVELTDSGKKSEIRPIGFISKRYSTKLKNRLTKVDDRTEVKEVSELNVLVASEFAKAALQCAGKFLSDMSRVDLIGSHGQTIYHNPPSRKSGVASTYQLGDIDTIAYKTGVTTVGDFRHSDIAAGGEGAPIMPYVDYLLFRDKRTTVLGQNIGGIANVTVVTPGFDDMIAFDTGPGNMLMDGIMRHYSKGKKLYDKNGAAASKGKVDEKLFKKLMSDEYYNYRPPKSTGADKFGIKAVSDLYKLIQSKKITFEDMMRTLLKLTVETMAAAYEKFIFPRYRVGKIVLSGGGTKNSYLVNELMKRLPGYEILISDEVGIPADAKEAIGMAVLANELISGNKTGLPSCTGAKRNVPLGKVSYNF